MLEELDRFTVAKLKKICQDENILNYNKLKKKELLTCIKRHKLQKMIDEGIEQLLSM